jgi:hypothetical protein
MNNKRVPKKIVVVDVIWCVKGGVVVDVMWYGKGVPRCDVWMLYVADTTECSAKATGVSTQHV